MNKFFKKLIEEQRCITVGELIHQLEKYPSKAEVYPLIDGKFDGYQDAGGGSFTIKLDVDGYIEDITAEDDGETEYVYLKIQSK